SYFSRSDSVVRRLTYPSLFEGDWLMVWLPLRASLILALVISLQGIPLGNALGGDVVAIEEHWQLSVGGPEIDRCAPQVTMVMSPVDNLNGDYFVFLVNHATFPQFAPGGLQLQRWIEDSVATTSNSDHNGILSYDQETVSWVQRMTLEEGVLTLDIEDGLSQSWGAFGQGANLSLSVNTNLERLNNYRPSISIGDSGIAFAGNRVSSLVLTKLVWTTEDGTVQEMVAPIDIDTDIDP
ncbi:MAG: hypothetical protein ACR2NU_07800, partial [Aeoliella sp.]